MMINKPNQYDVGTQEVEDAVFTDCRSLLKQIIEEMEYLGCDTLSWEECGDQVSKEDLDFICRKLETLTYVDTMY